MKKLILLLAALLVTSSAMAAATPNQPLQPLANSNPISFDGNLEFYGADTYRVESSTPAGVAVLLFAGKGFYYGTECSSGTATDFGLALDSASVSGITVATKGKALSGAVLTQVNTASTLVTTFAIDGSTSTTLTFAASGKSTPAGGAKRITNGLVFLKQGSGNSNCLVSALSDATIAAQAH